MINIDVTIITRADTLAVLIADTLFGFVTGIGVDVLAGVDASTALEFIVMRVSLEDALRFCC